MKISAVIDNVVATFSPESGIKRKILRDKLEKIRSNTYAAARTDRMTGGWTPTNASVNDILAASGAQVRARVRQLVRDFPYFARAVNILTDYTVGQGIYYQSRISDSSGKLNKKMIQMAEDSFNFWADEADIAGKLHFYELMRLAKRQDVESGEFLLIKHFIKDRSRYLPFALQSIEPDWMTDYGAKAVSPLNEIKNGLEFEKATGKVIRYHFTDPDGWGKTISVDADRVLHGFECLRPGQLTGISPFVSGVLVSRDLSEFLDATLDQAKLAAKYLAIVTTDKPSSWQTGLTNYEASDGTTQKTLEIENAIIEFIGSNEKVTFPSNPHPGDTFNPFVRFVLTMLSVSTGAPYELISGDYSGMNYTTMRTVRNDFAFQLRPIAARHIRQFGVPILKTFFDTAVMAGKLSFRNYFQNPAPYLRAEWQPPGMDAVDPLRESKAKIDEMTAGLRSPYEIAKTRGRDLEEIYKEIQQAKELAKQYGLEFGEVSTALANNPAALDGNKSKFEDLQFQLLELADALGDRIGRA